MTMFLIDGLSGTGKTTIYEELLRRGFHAVDSDSAFGYFGDPKTSEPTDEHHQLNWIWDKSKVKELADATKEGNVFVCGGAMNQNELRGLFEKQFTLKIDDETLRHRVLNRTNNNFGKEPEDLARLLEWNNGAELYARSIDAIVVDATRPLSEVVDDILEQSLGSTLLGRVS